MPYRPSDDLCALPQSNQNGDSSPKVYGRQYKVISIFIEKHEKEKKSLRIFYANIG